MAAWAIRGSAAVRLHGLWLGLAAGLALAACEIPEPPRQEPVPRPVAEDNGATTASVPAPPSAKPMPPIAAPPAKPSIEPQALVGLGEEEITRMLGEPREVRNDPPAMVWNYAINECRFDLFFYLDLKSQDFRALAYNFEPNTTSDGAKKVCLARIQEANRDRRR
jgi:hypothetical protein